MDEFQIFRKKKDYLICIDSDGCAMDTMDIKHIQCFGPCMVETWHLESWQEPILRRWNEINLYTMTRGINRFKALYMALAEIDRDYCKIEGLADLKCFVETAGELSNASVERAAAHRNSPMLQKALEWSEAVNRAIAQMPESFKKPFGGVLSALEKAHEHADIAIVSSANPEAVEEEWNRYGLMEYVDIVLTQNVGSKAFCIREMQKKGYQPDCVLMVGDAPGDAEAAFGNGVLYYPILVRREEESWERFSREALPKFLEQSYQGEYQEERMAEFRENLS